MRRVIWSGLVVVVCLVTAELLAQQSPSPSPIPIIALDAWVTSPSLWQTSNVQFPEGRGLGFRWLSEAHDAARASSRSLRLADLPVVEVIARFPNPNAVTVASGSPLGAVQIAIYNRGDSGRIDKGAFDALVDKTRAALTSLTGVTPLERGTDIGSAVQSRGLVWVTPTSRFLLEWSDTPENRVQGIDYRAEFIRLRVTPGGEQPKNFVEEHLAQSTLTAGAAQPKTVRAADLPARVVRQPDGTELLPNIPMVDQGRKGYCVTAATERVLRYYAVEVDQNELAEIANADARRGTSLDEMLDALKKLASRFRVLVTTEYGLAIPTSCATSATTTASRAPRLSQPAQL